METPVIDRLTKVGWYRMDNGGIPEEVRQYQMGGRPCNFMLGQIAYRDIVVFAQELERSIAHQGAHYRDMFARASPFLVDLIRAITYYTKQEFRGIGATGSQSTSILLSATDFMDPDGGAWSRRVSWRRYIPRPGTMDFIQLDIPNDEAMAILGFANMAANPCTAYVQVEQFAISRTPENMDFSLCTGGWTGVDDGPVVSYNSVPATDDFEKPDSQGLGGNLKDMLDQLERTERGETLETHVQDFPPKSANEVVHSLAGELVREVIRRSSKQSTIIELKEPILAFPNTPLKVVVNYFQEGWDELRPIGIRILPANKLNLPI